MSDIFDYLKWRGDIPFSQVPANPVDTLIFSSLSYVQFDGIVPENLQNSISLKEASEAVLAQPDSAEKARVKQDLELLKAAAETERFGNLRLAFYRSIFEAEEQTQFAAITFILDYDKTAVAFRGTDKTLTGWKEDFNMSFCESVPAQREALNYITELANEKDSSLIISGHSKGGNLAVYAAAKSDESVQNRIENIYNHDGPGFTEYMMGDAGYLAILPKIHTYIPQSSIVGMLLEHEEPYTIIKSSRIGVLQHDPYSWEVMGGDFIHTDEVGAGAGFINAGVRNWIAGMTMEERSSFADAIYELLSTGGVNLATDIINPKNMIACLRSLSEDEKNRRIITAELSSLIQSMKNIPWNKD